MSGLDAWIAARRAEAAQAMRAAISATHLTHRREEFGQTMRPARGSVLASVLPSRWDPEPDYFYHWPRDAAVAMRRLPGLIAGAEPKAARDWRECFAEIVRFSLATTDPDRPTLAANPLRPTTRPEALRHLRPDAALAALSGAALLGEPRCGADGGHDLENWSRPQFDGPAMRAAACLAAMAADPSLASDEVAALAARDLAFTVDNAGAPCIGPWEEAPARRDVFTMIAQWDALTLGAAWLRDEAASRAAEAAAARVAALVEQAWDEAAGCWRSHLGGGADDLDAAVIVAVAEADRADGPFAATGARAGRAADALAARFAALYPVNRGAGAALIGRWPGDAFFGGNPWLPTTLALAALRFRRGETAAGDAIMARLREVMPVEGFPEQLHRETGEPVSCRQLTWSAAAFLAAAEARDAAQAVRA